MLVKCTLALVAAAALLVRADDVDTDVESICGSDDSKGAVCYKDSEPRKYEVAQAVARLRLGRGGWCTGWLFGSEGHLITNHHCIRDASEAETLVAEFGAECDSCDSPLNDVKGKCTGVFVSNSSSLVFTDQQLDFSLVQLHLNDGESLASYGYLQARASGPRMDEDVYIAQHPRGKPTRLAITTDDGVSGKITTLHTKSCSGHLDASGHNVDTEPGSSGSPVLSVAENKVVALHNCGGCKATGGRNSAIKIDQVVAMMKANDVLPKDAIDDDDDDASVCSPIEDNADYKGHDMGSTARTSAELCCADCEATSGCKLFVWTDHQGGTCWLKDDQGDKVYNPHAKAASLRRDNSFACGHMSYNVDYFGHDIGSTSRASPDLCCDDCQANDDCKAFVWTHHVDGTCWLKSEAGDSSYAAGAVAVVM
ncbi:Aste57867_23819 [Aphanomyces stellatus]|uniref:Aste57867_23819 protein n=1 Tax=Aphanomyces stellatus TaxID=120398 RepID=A0A485LT68_9STRA|nr:hypothetical protein As57867_023746 [Aphanomyces stellatus]VFU00463.1 Aste57867_23819 [Aphanomyces stellatus]